MIIDIMNQTEIKMRYAFSRDKNTIFDDTHIKISFSIDYYECNNKSFIRNFTIGNTTCIDKRDIIVCFEI